MLFRFSLLSGRIFQHILLTTPKDVARSSPESANKYLKHLADLLASIPAGGMSQEGQDNTAALATLLRSSVLRSSTSGDLQQRGTAASGLLSLAVATASLGQVLDVVNWFLSGEKTDCKYELS